MRAFLNFALKEIYHITRDVRTLVVLIGMPAIQLILFGYAIRTEIDNADIGILDFSRDSETRRIVQKFSASKYFTIKENVSNFDELDELFKKGKIKQAIIFEPNFAKKLERDGKAKIQIVNDAANPNLATQINTYTKTIIADYQAKELSAVGTPQILISAETKLLYNPTMESARLFVPGLIAFILMLVSALMTSIALTREKEMGNMESLLASPLRPSVIIAGKVAPYVALALINAGTVLLLAMKIFNVPFAGNFLLFAGETCLYILTALSLGILISTIAESQQAAMMMALAGLLMPTMLLSGFIFPIENMPEWLRLLSSIIPARWFLIIIRGILLKGAGIELLWKETLILAGMAAIFLALSIKRFQVRKK